MLVKWVSALPTPIVPEIAYAAAIEARDSYPKCRRVVNALDTAHQFAFLYITAFLREYIRGNPDTARPEELALIFGSTMLRAPGSSAAVERSAGVSMLKKQAAFVLNFLVNEDAGDP